MTKIAEPTFTLTSGPVDAYPAVLRNLSRTVLYDYDPAFQMTYEKVNEKAQEAMRLSNPPVILHGEPVLGLEAAAASLIARDDVVLNLASGVYGKGFGYWAKRYCAELLEIEVAYNDAIDPAAVAAALKARPDVKIVSVCHHDTPSGTLNPIDAIGRIVADHGAYLIVDAVSSFGGMDVHPGGLPFRHLRHRAQQVPRLPAGAFAARRQPARLGQDEGQSGCAPRIDAEHPRLGRGMAARPAVPLHPFGCRDQRPRCGARSLSRRGAGERLGAPCADGRGLPRRREGDGPGDLAGARGDRLADDDGGARSRPESPTRRCGPRCGRDTAWHSPPGAARRSESSSASGTWGRPPGRSTR